MDLTREIIGAFYDVYRDLKGGFLESVYQSAFAIALRDRGLAFEQERALTVRFRDEPVGSFRADFVVESRVVLELKAARALAPEHEAQLLNYLLASELEIGFLFNFGPRPQFRRLICSAQNDVRARPRSSAVRPLPSDV